jgi:TonB family protein
VNPDFDRAARALLLVILDATVRALLLAALAALALAIVRPRRAAVRLGVWTAVLYGSLLVPVLGAVLPPFAWPLFASPAMQQVWAAVETMAAAAPVELAAAGPDPPPGAIPWLAGAGAIHAAGVLLLLLRAGIGWRMTRRLARGARPIDQGALLARVRELAAARGLSHAPRLSEADALRVPVTMFVIDPVVLLPADWRDWRAATLDAVLAHEIAHAARRDTLTQRLALLYRALTWCSPVSWWLHRRLVDLAEQASDDAALEAGAEPTAYATALVDFFARIRHEPQRATWHVAMARRADASAERRVDRILNWKGRAPMRHTRFSLIAIVATAVPVVTLAATVRPVASVRVESAAPSPAPGVTRLALPAADRGATQSAATVATPATPRRETRLEQATPAPSEDARRPPSRSAAQPQAKSQAQLIEEFRAGAYPATELPPGSAEPQALRQIQPKYTADAMRAKLQGTVVVEAVVGTSGTVERARIVQSLDPVTGLDREALVAALQWTFRPAIVNEAPVASYITLHLEFRLH